MDAKQEYFELIRLVNLANKTKNEQTEPEFFIEDEKLYFGVSKSQKVFLIEKKYGNWQIYENYQLEELKKSLVSFLNNNKSNLDFDLTHKILSHLFKNF